MKDQGYCGDFLDREYSIVTLPRRADGAIRK